MKTRTMALLLMLVLFTGTSKAIAQHRMPAASFDSNGVEIYYRQYGPAAAPVVILVHGFMVDSALNWRATVPHLNREFRVVTMDARGHGKSGAPVETEETEMSERAVAEDVIRLMDHLNVERAHVGGFSMGGLISLYLAAKYPERLLSAVIGGHGLVAREVLESSTQHLDATLNQAIQENKSVAELLTAQVAQLDPALFRYEPLLEFYTDLEDVATDPEALLKVHRTLAALAITADEAASITVPMLAISGDREPAYDSAAALRATNPTYTSVAVIPDYGHTNGFLSPTFNAIVRDFLLSKSVIGVGD